MNTNWITIFRAGDYRNQGKGNWDAARLKQVVDNYDPAYAEAPVTAGHPATDSPAWGYVAGLRLAGANLQARLKGLKEPFVESVRGGFYKYTSPKFYHDLNGRGPYLRHLAFLGGTPPGCKGLPPVEFSDSDEVVFCDLNIEELEFSDRGVAKNNSGGGEKMEKQLEELKTQLGNLTKTVENFVTGATERDAAFDDRLKKVEAGAGEKPEAKTETAKTDEFSDAQKAASEKLTSALASVEKLQARIEAEAKRRGCEEFCDGLALEGKILPFQKAGHVTTMMNLPAEEKTVEFDDNGKPALETPLDAYKRLLSAMPKIGPDTARLATGGADEFADDDRYYDAHKEYLGVSKEEFKKNPTLYKSTLKKAGVV